MFCRTPTRSAFAHLIERRGYVDPECQLQVWRADLVPVRCHDTIPERIVQIAKVRDHQLHRLEDFEDLLSLCCSLTLVDGGEMRIGRLEQRPRGIADLVGVGMQRVQERRV